MCLNGKLPWTIARWTELPDQYGPVSFKLSICRVRFEDGRVNGTIVLLGCVLKDRLLNKIEELGVAVKVGVFCFTCHATGKMIRMLREQRG